MRRLACLALLLAPGLLAQPLTPEEARQLLADAGSAFRQANELYLRDPAAARDLYRRAALRYERLARDGGIRNGPLFYNIGNAWFRSDDIGRAILNYRRAALFGSGDPNLAQNLAYARSRRADSFEERQEMRVLRTLLFFHYDLSLPARAVVFLLCAALFWAGAALRLFRRSWVPRWALAVAAALALVFLVSVAHDTVASPGRDSGVILAEQTTARKGDGDSYEPSFNEPLHAGTEFRLIEERQAWLHIELFDGRQCWIPSSSAGLVSRL